VSTIAALGRTTIQKLWATRYENPVVTKELRTRMRGGKAYLIMAAYIVLLGVILLIAYYNEWATYRGSYDPQMWGNAKIGLKLFSDLTWGQAICIALIAPSLTAGSITHEREQLTLEILSLTSLSPRNIVAGKVSAAMLYILMLLACSLPLAGICLILGSISPLEILLTYVLLAVWSFLFCSVGVFFSSVLKRTATSFLVSYVMVIIYGVVTTWIAIVAMDAWRYSSGPKWDFIFSGLSACAAADHVLNTALVITMKLPVALVGIAAQISIAMLLLTVAVTRQSYHRAEKPLHIRLWLLGITVVGAFLLFGNLASMPYGFTSSALDDYSSFMFAVVSVMVMACIPVMVTGPHKSVGILKDIVFGPARSKIFANRLAGGFWFVLLWFVLCASTVAIVLLWFSSSPVVAASPTGHYRMPDWINIIQAAVALTAMIMGLASVGVLTSCLLPNRQWAAGVTLLFIVLAWCVYPTMQAQHIGMFQGSSWSDATGFQWLVAYLWPGVMMDRLSGGWIQGQNAPNLPLASQDAWIGCVIAWVIFACVSLWLANKFASKGKGIKED
jgi:ABC-type transport system involved in multi-copper enzyme maturation permease subunit